MLAALIFAVILVAYDVGKYHASKKYDNEISYLCSHIYKGGKNSEEDK